MADMLLNRADPKDGLRTFTGNTSDHRRFVTTHSTRFVNVISILLILLPFATPSRPGAAVPDTQFRRWGLETLQMIETEFRKPGSDLYAETARLDGTQGGFAYMWPAGIQFHALNCAARIDPAIWTPRVAAFSQALQAYWRYQNSLWGYTAAISGGDRYYDDNAWIVLAQMEAHQLTSNALYLDRAKSIMTFVLSGKDTVRGGGIYWRESPKTEKNTCSNAPAAVGALKLYQATGILSYRTAAQEIMTWLNATLQKPNGIYWDHIDVATGNITTWEFTYNTALPMQANLLFYKILGQSFYLAEAQRLAGAAETRWIDAGTGKMKDEAAFCYTLVDAYLALYETDKNPRWKHIVRRALFYLHDQIRDANGHYPKRWDRYNSDETRPLTEYKLLHQAAAARAYLNAAIHRTAPAVTAASEYTVGGPQAVVALDASVRFDALADPAGNTIAWSLVAGPGPTVTFDHPAQASTNAHFSSPGDYRLSLLASDGELVSSTTVSVRVLPHTAVENWRLWN